MFKPLTLPSPGVYRDVADRDKAFEESLAELERILNEEGDEITALVDGAISTSSCGHARNASWLFKTGSRVNRET